MRYEGFLGLWVFIRIVGLFFFLLLALPELDIGIGTFFAWHSVGCVLVGEDERW